MPDLREPLGSRAVAAARRRRLSQLRALLWFRVRTEANAMIADVITGKVPTNQDIVRVSQAFISRGSPPYVILNLSGVQLVSSSFIAGLIALNKRLNDAKGKLVLCELTPVVHETLTGQAGPNPDTRREGKRREGNFLAPGCPPGTSNGVRRGLKAFTFPARAAAWQAHAAFALDCGRLLFNTGI